MKILVIILSLFITTVANADTKGQALSKVSEEEAKSITENAIHYQDNWKKYSKSVF